jgi:hypothetical protein
MSVCVNVGILSELLMLTGIADFGLLNYSCFAKEKFSAVAFPTANSFHSSVTNSTLIFISKA